MIGVFSVKKLVIWHAIAPTYGAMIVTIMDMLPWTAQIKYCHPVHPHVAGLTPATGLTDVPLDIIVTLDITVIPDTHHITTGTGLDSVALDLAPVTSAIGVVAAMTLAKVTPDHPTDLHITTSHVTGAPVPPATIATHLTADLHLIGILPEMTADLNIGPGNNITNQTQDLHPLHRYLLGNIRTKDTNKSQLTTHHQSTTAQMTMKATQTMI